MSNVLIAGSTGFIGRRLVQSLLEEGHHVYALIRTKGVMFQQKDHPHLHTIYGEVNPSSDLDLFPKEIDAAYYLMHSLAHTDVSLVEKERAIARAFLQLLNQTKAKQIIYLTGIIEDEHALSPHLQSRLAVERILREGSIPCTSLRASLIIGSGSASFEIIRDLVEKLPILITPKWVRNLCQPIAVRDVLFYLKAVLLNSRTFNQIYDIGGPEVLTFQEVLQRYAKFRKLKRWIIEVPLLTPRLSTYWLVFISSVRFSICQYLIESMKHATRKKIGNIDAILPHTCVSYESALEKTFEKIAQNEVISSWMDSWGKQRDISAFIQVPKEGCYQNIQAVSLRRSIDEVQDAIWSIGGKKGWYSMNWAWKLRGFVDRCIGGIGMNRGRRHPTQLEVGDSIDFWRVLLADQEHHRIILYCEMKLPGEAWLELEIDSQKRQLKQTATFRPRGLWGRVYWYLLYPFHVWIFKNMAKAIA